MIFFLVVFVVSIINSASSAKLPNNIGRCKRSSPDIKECLTKNIPSAIKSFKDGNEELGLPSLDPLRIPSMVIGEGTGPVNVVQNFSNVEMRGLLDLEMTVNDADFDKNIIIAETLTYKIELLADYNLDGQILVLPIRGHGKCNITIINAKSKFQLIGEKHEKKGKTYFRLKEYRVKMEPEKMFYNFENLFDGDERLGSEINKILNENWKEVYSDVQESYDKTFSLIFLKLANSLFGRVLYNDIFLP